MKPEFPRQIPEKKADIKFHGNPSIGNRVVLIGQRNERTDAQMDRDT